MLLRTYKPEDAAALFAVIDTNRSHLRPWLPWVDSTLREEHSLLFIEHALSQLHHQEGLAMGIFYNSELIGGIGMHQWDHKLRKAQVGYWISTRYQGRGIMVRCLQAFLDYLFENLSLNKVEIQFIAANHRSASLAAKLGASVEGVLRESCLVSGRLEDLIVTGILCREWIANKKAAV